MTAPAEPTPLAEWDAVEPGVLYRCQQPGYEPRLDRDTPHAFTDAQILFLRAHAISLVLSANSIALEDADVAALRDAGIDYRHFPVTDYTAPTRDQVIRASTALAANSRDGGASLVYCGFGHGRTGTFVTAWEILTDHPLRQAAASVRELCEANHVERQTQRDLLERLDATSRGLLADDGSSESDSSSGSDDTSDSSDTSSDTSSDDTSSDSDYRPDDDGGEPERGGEGRIGTGVADGR
ncbi:hypothetical protein [Actinosynnema sp. NPDC020468]|uniref:protein-tyrosine phosphatase family protein n=1 Tax=Actinosynnema sp. NPDC020468 TaxID=3154488 RepID=UPI0033D7EDDA